MKETAVADILCMKDETAPVNRGHQCTSADRQMRCIMDGQMVRMHEVVLWL